MPLTCGCYTDDLEDAEYYWFEPIEYREPPAGRRRRCRSCKALIDNKPGSLALEFTRFRYPNHDVELEIYGSESAEVPLGSWWLCETCGDLYFSLVEMGYCGDPGENQHELLAEHHAIRALDGVQLEMGGLG